MDASPFGPDAHSPLTGPLYPLDSCPSYGSPVVLIKFRIFPTLSSDILRVQEKGAQVSVSVCR
jgi:hypothetical protein